MPILSFSPAGEIGLVQDTAPAEVPATAWTDGLNIHFREGAVEAARASTQHGSATPVDFYWGFSAVTPANNTTIWLLTGLTKAYAYLGGQYFNVTRAAGDYTGNGGNRWTGGFLNGIVVANNGVDKPQYWATVDQAVLLQDLPNWPANTKCATLRSFKNALVALDITKGATRYPTMVKWSHPADPGTVPASWDETDPTKDAGEFSLSETPGYCIDAVPLRDINIIYKQDSVWGMQFIGGVFVYRFYKIFSDFGMPTRDCAIEFTSGKHLVFTGDDLVVHDGQSAQSIVHGRLRRVLRTIGDAQLPSCYMALHRNAKEVWFCFRRQSDATVGADTALVYNWMQNSLTLRTLPGCTYVQLGRVDPVQPQETTWTATIGDWEGKDLAWGETLPSPMAQELIGITPGALRVLDHSSQDVEPGFLEKTYFGIQMQATKPPDMSSVKFIRRIWPRFLGISGQVLQIQLGACMGVAEPIVWEPARQFIIGTDTKVDCTLSGKLFGIRIISQNTAPWKLNGLDADVTLVSQN